MECFFVLTAGINYLYYRSTHLEISADTKIISIGFTIIIFCKSREDILFPFNMVLHDMAFKYALKRKQLSPIGCIEHGRH